MRSRIEQLLCSDSSESNEIFTPQNCCKDGNYTRLFSQAYDVHNAIGTLRQIVARNAAADAVSVAHCGWNLRCQPRAPRGLLCRELEGCTPTEAQLRRAGAGVFQLYIQSRARPSPISEVQAGGRNHLRLPRVPLGLLQVRWEADGSSKIPSRLERVPQI